MKSESRVQGVFRHVFTVPESAVDRNGHVNNVEYVRWMQDVAVLHSDATGGTRAMHRSGATWVVRSHRIEYLNPTYAGEKVTALTWVEAFRRVRSVRRYRFLRASDDAPLAEGETEWVFVDAETGKPRKIPPEVERLFPPVKDR